VAAAQRRARARVLGEGAGGVAAPFIGLGERIRSRRTWRCGRVRAQTLVPVGRGSGAARAGEAKVRDGGQSPAASEREAEAWEQAGARELGRSEGDAKTGRNEKMGPKKKRGGITFV